MKTIDELGISPAPWTFTVADDMYHAGVDDKEENGICETYIGENSPDRESNNARLIAAAPEMYEALRDAIERNCTNCVLLNDDGSCSQTDCDCVVQRWKSVLEKASGEKVRNTNESH